MTTAEVMQEIKKINTLVWNEAIDKCIAVAKEPDAVERMRALKEKEHTQSK